MQRLLVPTGAIVVVGLVVGAVLFSSGDANETAMSRPTPSPTPPLLSAVTPSSVDSPTPASASLPEADEILLRLTDLPPGYMIGDDSGCGQIAQEGSDSALSRYIEGEYPRFCDRQLEYVCQAGRTEHALVVTSGIVYLSSEQKATEAMEIIPSISRWFGTISASPRPDAVAIGDEARTFDAEGINQTAGLLIAWRNGRTLNFIEVIEPLAATR